MKPLYKQVDTLEHNQMQANFLDKEYVKKVLTGLKLVSDNCVINEPEFEFYGWDVMVKYFDTSSRTVGTLFVLCVPHVGENYSSVYRALPEKYHVENNLNPTTTLILMNTFDSAVPLSSVREMLFDRKGLYYTPRDPVDLLDIDRVDAIDVKWYLTYELV